LGTELTSHSICQKIGTAGNLARSARRSRLGITEDNSYCVSRNDLEVFPVFSELVLT